MITAIELEMQAVQQQRFRDARPHQRARCAQRTLAFLRKREADTRPLPPPRLPAPAAGRTYWL